MRDGAIRPPRRRGPPEGARSFHRRSKRRWARPLASICCPRRQPGRQLRQSSGSPQLRAISAKSSGARHAWGGKRGVTWRPAVEVDLTSQAGGGETQTIRPGWCCSSRRPASYATRPPSSPPAALARHLSASSTNTTCPRTQDLEDLLRLPSVAPIHLSRKF